MLSVLLYSILSVQVVYSVQLNCAYSNYTEAAATCSAAQQHCTFTVQILYKLYSLQLNCTYSNYTEAAATCSAAQQHCTFTVQMLYKLYSLQLNCTYSNYTEAAATCSAAQQQCTFTLQILYKLYILQINCTYSNYTEAAATCSAAKQHTNSPADVFWSAVHLAVLNYTCISTYTISLAIRSDLSDSRYCHKTQCHLLTALRNTPRCSSLWNCIYINRQSHPEIRSFKFTLLAASAVSQFDSDKEQVDVTKITDTLCKLKKKFSMLWKCVCKFSVTYPLYYNLHFIFENTHG